MEKGSMGTAVDHGSVDPKGRDNSCSKSDGRCKRRASITRKGSGLIFPHPDTADLVHRSTLPCSGSRFFGAAFSRTFGSRGETERYRPNRGKGGHGAVTLSLSETPAAGPGRVFSSC